jgi:IS30 family transposase
MHSEKTIYNYVGKGLLSAKNLDLRRKVRFRPRKSRHESLKVDRSCHIGRTYLDYKSHIANNPKEHTVEMDTVYGRIGGKCLLTLHFVNAHFMLAYIMDACTSAAVAKAFTWVRETLGTDLYSRFFPLLLGDRGSEFTNPKTIEFDVEGEGVSRVFYCDPQQSQQKGSLENNHRFIRYVIPKGSSMDHFTQKDVSLMMSHINSYGRYELKERTPYHMFEFMFGEDGKEVLKKLDVNLVLPNEIVLRPKLLKKH